MINQKCEAELRPAKEFLEFVLNSYHTDGYETLSEKSFSSFLEIKYGSLIEAQSVFGDLGAVKSNFLELQEELYS